MAVEAPLLAAFAVGSVREPVSHVVDLGAGPGAVSLMIVAMGWAESGSAIEIDPLHARLAQENVEANGLANRMTVHHADAADARVAPADLVVANPPWFEPAHGAIAPDPTRAGARAFTRGTLASFVQAARRLVSARGRVSLSMPSVRSHELMAQLAGVGLHAKRLRFLHPRPNREAQVVLVEARPTRPGGLVIEPPLFVRGIAGEKYTREVDDTLRGRWIRTASAAEERAEAGLPSARAGESDPE